MHVRYDQKFWELISDNNSAVLFRITETEFGWLDLYLIAPTDNYTAKGLTIAGDHLESLMWWLSEFQASRKYRDQRVRR